MTYKEEPETFVPAYNPTLRQRLRNWFGKDEIIVHKTPAKRLCDEVGIEDEWKAFCIDVAVQRIKIEGKQPPYERFFVGLNEHEIRIAINYLNSER